jgi:uncharacterized membrane protein HdeD (DUF308 family)
MADCPVATGRTKEQEGEEGALMTDERKPVYEERKPVYEDVRTQARDSLMYAAHGMFQRAWWAIALRGLLAIVLGVLILSWPGETLAILLALLGIYCFFDGVFALVATFQAAHEQRQWWPYLLEGLLSIAIGILVFARPAAAALALVLLIAIRCIVTGAVEISSASALRRTTGSSHWALWLGGLASLVFGVLILFRPFAGLSVLLWLAGIYCIVFGVMVIITAFGVRGRAERAVAHRLS